MCDYSLMHAKSRPAAIGDRLTVSSFHGTITKGFTGPEDGDTAVCILPGTELAFEAPVESYNPLCPTGFQQHSDRATFRQINIEHVYQHHDALEFPDGTVTLVTLLKEGQCATVLQMPAPPRTAEEAKAQERLAITA